MTSTAPAAANLAPKVLVTGASSFLGAWIVHTLLERGYRVRGAVNDLAKGQYISRIFAAHPGRFEFVVVPDISVEDAFLDALVGIDAVIHTAYPVVKDPKGHPNNVFGPVVRATVGILKTIVDFIPTVKRVIITSSVAAAEEPRAQPFTYTGDLWNDFAIKHCEQNGVASNPTLKYIASKTLAERAAWDYVHNNADLVHFDLVSILPGYILGPSLHPVSTPDSLQFSTRMMMDALANPKNGEELTNPVGAWVDVRDLANVHASALTSTSVVGKRIVACAGSFNWQDMYDALNSASLPGVPVGHPNSSRKPKHAYKSDIALSLIQARRFKTLADTARDTVIAARKVKDGVPAGFTWDLRLAPNGGGALQGSGLKSHTFESLEGGFSPSRFSF